MILSAISNEKRLRLILCLSKPQSVNELLEKCTLSQSALSQHLIKLKEAGIVKCSRDGNKQIYSVSDKKYFQVAKLLLSLI